MKKLKIRTSEDMYEDDLSMLDYYKEDQEDSVVSGLIATMESAVQQYMDNIGVSFDTQYELTDTSMYGDEMTEVTYTVTMEKEEDL